MKTSLPTRRRWFRFSLRTMLVLVTLVCIYLGWAMNWIRQRQEFLDQRNILRYISYDNPRNEPVAWHADVAPLPLRWLGEGGIFSLELGKESREDFERAWELFPEARSISRIDESGNPEAGERYFQGPVIPGCLRTGPTREQSPNPQTPFSARLTTATREA